MVNERFTFSTSRLGHIDFKEQTAEDFRSKQEYPYAYSPFTSWVNPKFRNDPDKMRSMYSDRMNEWNPKKNRELQRIHLGKESDYMDDFLVGQLVNYVSAYVEAEIEMVRIVEHCNWSHGFPCWQFYFVHKEDLV